MKAIDLDEAIARFIQAGQNMSKDQVIYMLNRIPTTEIVKCKDCKWYESGGLPCPLDLCESLGDDGFCSYGEARRE